MLILTDIVLRIELEEDSKIEYVTTVYSIFQHISLCFL